jgi:hypothetical protein
VGPCNQWSTRALELGTLMRHFIELSLLIPGVALVVATPAQRACCVRHAAAVAVLVAACGTALGRIAGLPRTGPTAIALATVAGAAQHDLAAAARAQVQTG